MSAYTGVQKRMRKGTKSCLPCRKRKIKCSGASNDDTPCRECELRGGECVAQGKVGDDNEDAVALSRRLQERVAHLEASLKELTKSSNASPSTTHTDRDTLEQRVHLPTPTVGHDATPAVSNDQGGLQAQHEQTIDSSTAPFIQLLSNSLLGTASGALLGTVSDRTNETQSAHRSSTKDQECVRNLLSCLPTEAEIVTICDTQGSWWPLYRDCLGCIWGDGDLPTLLSFATQVLQELKPPMLGLLLVCFAISTGEIHRYLPAVERQIVNDDEYAGTEGGLNCLMALGLCYMSSLQPRRAWMVHRKANGLIQLNGIHIRRRTDKHEILFWELFHADRWLSLMIGLPYMMPDHLCDLTLPPIGEIDEGTWLYRKLGIVTGRVIDCLQAVQGATLSATLQVEEDMERIKAQLSPGYLDICSIRQVIEPMQKYIRLYRVVHFYQLRSFVHLPFLLRSATQERYEFSGKSCTDDSRKMLEAYLEIYDSNPLMITNATVMSFNVFICCGILLLSLIGYGRSKTSEYVLSQAQLREDWFLFNRVMEVLKVGSKDRSVGMLCQTCYTALESLLASARGGPGNAAKKVVLPYFGTLSITRHHSGPEKSVQVEETCGSWQGPVNALYNDQSVSGAAASTSSVPFDMNFASGMEFAYDGPFLPDGNVADWMGVHGDIGFDWFGASKTGADGTDWSWLGADLPPNVGM